MSAIRPEFPSPPPAGSAGPSAQVRAAQASFFRAALGAVEAGSPGPRPQADTATPPEQTRPMRPGALLDIRV